jgi:ribonucleoside-diphosphate reductase alpha chain
MQKAVQPWVCTSISKTVNCPKDMPFEDFEQLYMDAYDGGLKCCAAFREGTIANAVLQVKPKPAPEEPSPFNEPLPDRLKSPFQWQDPQVLTSKGNGLDATISAPMTKTEILALIQEASGVTAPVSRKPVMPGYTHKIKWGMHAIYITINNTPDGAPYEIFVNSKHSEHYEWTVALTRMISAIWRRGGDVSFVIEELKSIHSPRGGAYMNGRYVPSVPAAIGLVIEAHLAGITNGFELQPEAEDVDPRIESPALAAVIASLSNPIAGMKGEPVLSPGLAEAAAARLFNFCPKCGSTNVWFPKPKCLTCRDCSYSNCD